MSSRFRFALVLAFFLTATVAPTPAVGRAQSEATEAVCVGLGGDALSLVEWTAAEIAAHEARFGQPVLRAHPETGTCHDPSGLPLGADPTDLVYVCSQDAEGGWHGPAWVYPIYLLPDAVAPDPATGGCPLPRSRLVPATPEEERAAATAVYLSQLEAAGDIALLYDWLHPDAKAIVPEAAVAGWYAAELAPRGPEPITVERVRLVSWTWEVTGETYPETAEVSYRQRFADGSVVADVMRLVRNNDGGWNWFFGRDRAFVEEQIAKYGGAATPVPS